MAYQVRNIIVGAAALYLSAQDSSTWTAAPALPAAVPGTPYATTLEGAAAYRHAGFTSEGLELSYEPDYGDVEVDQLLDSAKIFKQGMRVALNTTLVEANLENLLIAWGQGSNTFTSSATAADVTRFGSTLATGDSGIGIAGGSLGDEPIERVLVAVGPGPRNATTGGKRERVYYGRRVLSVESSSLAVRRNEATMFPVSFRLLPDPLAAAGTEYGVIRDRNL